MRIIWFLLLLIAVVNLILFVIGNILGINIYKTYGKQIINAFWKFIMLLLTLYIAVMLAGLAQ